MNDKTLASYISRTRSFLRVNGMAASQHEIALGLLRITQKDIEHLLHALVEYRSWTVNTLSFEQVGTEEMNKEIAEIDTLTAKLTILKHKKEGNAE